MLATGGIVWRRLERLRAKEASRKFWDKGTATEDLYFLIGLQISINSHIVYAVRKTSEKRFIDLRASFRGRCGDKTLLNGLELLFLFSLHSSKIRPSLLIIVIFLLFLEYLNIFSFHWKRKIMLIKDGSFKWVFVSQLYRVAKSLSLSHIVKQQAKQPLRRRPRKTSLKLRDSVLSYPASRGFSRPDVT